MKKYNLSNGSRLVSSSESLPEIPWFTIYNTLNKLNHTDKNTRMIIRVGLLLLKK